MAILACRLRRADGGPCAQRRALPGSASGGVESGRGREWHPENMALGGRGLAASGQRPAAQRRQGCLGMMGRICCVRWSRWLGWSSSLEMGQRRCKTAMDGQGRAWLSPRQTRYPPSPSIPDRCLAPKDATEHADARRTTGQSTHCRIPIQARRAPSLRAQPIGQARRGSANGPPVCAIAQVEQRYLGRHE